MGVGCSSSEVLQSCKRHEEEVEEGCNLIGIALSDIDKDVGRAVSSTATAGGDSMCKVFGDVPKDHVSMAPMPESKKMPVQAPEAVMLLGTRLDKPPTQRPTPAVLQQVYDRASAVKLRAEQQQGGNRGRTAEMEPKTPKGSRITGREPRDASAVTTASERKHVEDWSDDESGDDDDPRLHQSAAEMRCCSVLMGSRMEDLDDDLKNRKELEMEEIQMSQMGDWGLESPKNCGSPRTPGSGKRKGKRSSVRLFPTLDRRVSQRLQLIIENPRNISEFYDVSENCLGKGSYGTVSKAEVKGTGAVRAVKSISKEQSDMGIWRLKTEISITKMIDHPNVIKLYEIFEDFRNLYLVMELCSGGQLHSRITKAGCFREDQSKLCMLQILRGIYYMHSCKICHRDLKPQNILCSTTDPIETTSLKITDFGLSCRFLEGRSLSAQVGTTAYMAPQVFERCYDHGCDIWSAGVIMYFMLVGYLPFLSKGGGKEAMKKRIMRGRVRFRDADWLTMSQDSMDLIRKCIVHPRSRHSAKEALDHPWMVKALPSQEHFPTNQSKEKIVNSLREFRTQNKFMKAACHLVVSLLSEKQTRVARNTFMWFDTDGDGLLSLAEMRKRLGNLEADEELFQKDDNEKELRELGYTEFLAATFNRDLYVKRDVCKAAFTVFDIDGDGSITMEELTSGKSMLGRLSSEEAAHLVADLDRNGDEEIDFEEFFAMMRPNDEGKGYSRPSSPVSPVSPAFKELSGGPEVSRTLSRNGAETPTRTGRRTVSRSKSLGDLPPPLAEDEVVPQSARVSGTKAKSRGVPRAPGVAKAASKSAARQPLLRQDTGTSTPRKDSPAPAAAKAASKSGARHPLVRQDTGTSTPRKEPASGKAVTVAKMGGAAKAKAFLVKPDHAKSDHVKRDDVAGDAQGLKSSSRKDVPEGKRTIPRPKPNLKIVTKN